MDDVLQISANDAIYFLAVYTVCVACVVHILTLAYAHRAFVRPAWKAAHAAIDRALAYYDEQQANMKVAAEHLRMRNQTARKLWGAAANATKMASVENADGALVHMLAAVNFTAATLAEDDAALFHVYRMIGQHDLEKLRKKDHEES